MTTYRDVVTGGKTVRVAMTQADLDALAPATAPDLKSETDDIKARLDVLEAKGRV